MTTGTTTSSIDGARELFALAAKQPGFKFDNSHVTDIPGFAELADRWLQTTKSTFAFVIDVQRAVARYGSMTDSQARGILNVMLAEARRATERPYEPIDLSAINAFFYRVNPKLKWPKVSLALPDGTPVTIRPKTSGMHAGAVEITGAEEWNERFGRFAPHWYGRIETDGTVTYGKGWNTIEALAKAFAEDPAKTASEYGRLTGNCCFCRLPLSDPRSTEQGYGEICASNWNLPWGKKAA